MILSLDLLIKETNEIATYEFIKDIYERDPRYNIAIDESRSYKCGFAKENIFNPSVMSRFFKGDVNVTYFFDDILEFFKNDKNKDVEIIYKIILSLPILNIETNEPPTYSFVKKLYEREPKFNISFEKIREDQNFINLDESGIDKFPINIRYFEISNTISNTQQLIESIRILCSSEFLTHEESSKIATFLGINTIVFPMGHTYKEPFRLIDEIEGSPEIFLVNLRNIHWNMISFKQNNIERKLRIGVNDETKQIIFNSLKNYFELGRL